MSEIIWTEYYQMVDTFKAAKEDRESKIANRYSNLPRTPENDFKMFQEIADSNRVFEIGMMDAYDNREHQLARERDDELKGEIVRTEEKYRADVDRIQRDFLKEQAAYLSDMKDTSADS